MATKLTKPVKLLITLKKVCGLKKASKPTMAHFHSTVKRHASILQHQKAWKCPGAIDSTFQPLANIPTVNGYTGWVNHSWTKGTTPFKYVNDDNRDKMTDEKSLDFFKDKMKKLEKRNNAKPFFFAVGIIRPHTPLVVPQKYYDKFPVDSIQLNRCN